MEETVSYSTQYLYDTLKIGITIPVRLVVNDSIAVFEAKLDTGSANCIFERVHGENLGLIIESGENKYSRLLPELLRLTRTKSV